MAERNMAVSDTVTVTHDGRTVVDAKKLFAKPHVREMINKMRSKTRQVRRDSAGNLVVVPSPSK